MTIEGKSLVVFCFLHASKRTGLNLKCSNQCVRADDVPWKSPDVWC